MLFSYLLWCWLQGDVASSAIDQCLIPKLARRKFQKTVEYTGEVKSAKVVQSDIDATDFLRKIKDMIMATDFSPWARHDDDAQFIYPMTFTRWWEK